MRGACVQHGRRPLHRGLTVERQAGEGQVRRRAGSASRVCRAEKPLWSPVRETSKPLAVSVAVMVSASFGGAASCARRSSLRQQRLQAGRDDGAVGDRNDGVAAAAVEADGDARLLGAVRGEDGAAARARRDGDDGVYGRIDLLEGERGDRPGCA